MERAFSDTHLLWSTLIFGGAFLLNDQRSCRKQLRWICNPLRPLRSLREPSPTGPGDLWCGPIGPSDRS